MAGSVYLLADDAREGIYKIGVTRGKIENRIKKLQTGNSSPIHMVLSYETDYPFVMESMLHTKYGGNRVLNEWFEMTDDEVVNFRKACEEIQNTIDVLKTNYWFRKKHRID